MLIALFVLFLLFGGGHFIFALATGVLFHPIHAFGELVLIVVLAYLARKLIDRYVAAKE